MELTERQTKGAGVEYEFTTESATVSVTLHQGHVLAEDDEWLEPAGRSWRTVGDPIALVVARLSSGIGGARC